MRKYVALFIAGLAAFAGLTTAEAVNYSPAAEVRSRNYGSGALGPWQNWNHGVVGDWVGPQHDGDPIADVGLIGDSITTATWPATQTRLAAEGKTLAVNYWSGRPLVGSGAVNWLLSLSTKPPVIVLALGTNDIFNPVGVAAEINRLEAGLPDTTTLVVVDVYVDRWAYDPAVRMADIRNTGWVNVQIHDACQAPCKIVPWFGYFASDPNRAGNYLKDGVHTKDDAVSENFRAGAIASVV